MEKKKRTGWAYSPAKIYRELKMVEWPGVKSLLSSSLLVIVFTFAFGFYFFLCELLSTGLIRALVNL